MLIIIVSVIVKEVLVLVLVCTLKFTVFIGIIAVFVEGEICVLHLIVKWLCL